MKRRLKKHVDSWRDWLAPEDCFSRFKNRLIAKLGEWHIKARNRFQVENRFALLCGHPVPAGPLAGLIRELKPDFAETCIHEAVQEAKNLKELCFTVECLFAAAEEHDSRSLVPLERAVRKALEISPGIPITFRCQGREITFRPDGDRFLDKGVVDHVILSLAGHPSVSKHFHEALKICASGETARYRNALDNLRFALETLLKKVLCNTKSLENQKPVLLPWLKERGLHQQVINMYESLLFGPYSVYQNDAVKHNETFSPIEVELIIYLTGAFMRLLLDLNAICAATATPPALKLAASSSASTA